jgi:hypothetical protein
MGSLCNHIVHPDFRLAPRPPPHGGASFLSGVRLPTFGDGTRSWRDAHLSKRGYSPVFFGWVGRVKATPARLEGGKGDARHRNGTPVGVTFRSIVPRAPTQRRCGVIMSVRVSALFGYSALDWIRWRTVGSEKSR